MKRLPADLPDADALRDLIRYSTREAGVRTLEREQCVHA